MSKRFNRVYERAYAKINLSLDVVGKREDGYHLLEMIMQTIDLYDEVIISRMDAVMNFEPNTVEENQEDSAGVVLECDKDFLNNKNNLIYKAAVLFKNKYGIDEAVRIKLNKHIPIGAGLAGGSSDAAAVLRGMARLFSVEPTEQEYLEMCVELGADVFYCLKGGTALARGIGEELTFLEPLSEVPILLIKPKYGVSTPKAYKQLKWDEIEEHPDTERLIRAIESKSIVELTQEMVNVLEVPVFEMYPNLRGIKKMLVDFGAMGALMSGSGSCVFGVFASVKERNRAYFRIVNSIKNRYDLVSRQMMCTGVFKENAGGKR